MAAKYLIQVTELSPRASFRAPDTRAPCFSISVWRGDEPTFVLRDTFATRHEADAFFRGLTAMMRRGSYKLENIKEGDL
jgi:hypothetical protein